jgi:hypothetical protein
VTEGWVYFARDGDRTKIGWTSSGIQKRLRSLRTAAPTIEMVHAIRTDDKQLEREIHKVFKDYRIGGEWFALPDDWRSMLPEEHRRRASRMAEVAFGEWDRGSLVGSWFHSFNAEGEVRWQGCVVADLGDYYLVQTYEWFMGDPSFQQLASLSDMADWKFYDTNDEMLDFYERVLRRPDSQLIAAASQPGEPS